MNKIANKVTLKARTRDVFGHKTKKGRKEGLIPAVVYGHAVKSQSLWIDAFNFSKILKIAGESTIIELNVDNKKKRNVIIYETQKDPVSEKFIHADFFQVRMDKEIETEVELVYIGESPAVKELGGVLIKNMDEVKVKCFPIDFPSEIKVDTAALKKFEDCIYIKDLKISSKIKVNLDPETVVALVSAPRSEEELEELEEKVEEDVTKVEGTEKETIPEAEEEKKESEKEEEKEKK